MGNDPKLARLERRRRALLREQQQLAQDNATLHSKAAVLGAWCQCFQFLKSANTTGLVDGASTLLAAEEAMLLQQLRAADAAGAVAAKGLAPLTVPGTIAPQGDPSLLFRDLVTRPAHPDAATITSTQLALYYRQMVQQLGMQLHLLGGPHEVLCRPLEQIQLLLDQYLHLVASLALAGRDDVIEGFVGYNLQTMEPLDLATCDHKAAAAAVVASLGLLAQQEDMIAHSLGVGAPMLQAVLAEWQQARQELVTDLSAPAAGAPQAQPSTGGGSSSSGRSQGSQHGLQLNLQPDELTVQSGSLQLLQQRLTRLHTAMRKKYTLLMIICCWVFGSLTWVQAAQLATRFWPLAAPIMPIAHAVQQQREARLQASAGK